MIYVTREKEKSVGAASIVTLRPPCSWHVDSISEYRDIVGDYHLTRLASGKTRLDIVFRVERKSSTTPSKMEFLRHINEIWNQYVATIEGEYRKQSKR